MIMGSERILACIAFILVCCTGAVAAEIIEVHVRPVIIASDQGIRASDVFIYHENKKTIHFHLSSDAGSIFGPRAALVPMWQLSGLVPASLKQGDHDKVISLVGSRAVYIPPEIPTKAMRVLITKILHNVSAEFADSRERAEVEITYMPTTLKGFEKPNAEIDGRLTAELLSKRKTSRNSTDMRFLVQCGTTEGVITVEVSRYTPYFVSQRNLKRAEIVGSEKLTRNPFPVGNYPQALQSVDTTEFEARTTINAGEPLTVRNARIKPVIEPGDTVRVTMRRGPVQLRMPGNARAEAGLNDTVAVRLETGVIKECRVKAEGEVVLE